MSRQVVYSFRCAIEGVKEAWKKERNFRIHCTFAIITIILAALLHFTLVKWMVLLMTIGIVMCLEVVNSALERVVNLVTSDYHPIAKQAKDLAAGAVFLFSIIAVIIGILLFVEPIIKYVFY